MVHVDVVIARYAEDISWTQHIPYRVIVYNKGKNDLPNAIQLPNKGREAHTYIEHIARNYEQLDPNGVTVFSQGMLSDRLQGKPEYIYILELANEAMAYGFSESKASWHHLLPMYQPYEHFRIFEWPPGSPLTPNNRNETFGQWFRRCIEVQTMPTYVRWVIGAIFAVSNRNILSRSKEYYQRLLNEFDDSTAPEVAHFFERAWYYIFNHNQVVHA